MELKKQFHYQRNIDLVFLHSFLRDYVVQVRQEDILLVENFNYTKYIQLKGRVYQRTVSFLVLDKEGNYLSEQWFDWAYDFREGYAVVQLKGKYNFIY